jgi:hypothetical protein
VRGSGTRPEAERVLAEARDRAAAGAGA